MANRPRIALALTICLVLVNLTGLCHGQLQYGYYKGKCLFDVESIVRGAVRAKFFRDRTIVAALLRMQFHDCFVHGCDASILLDGATTEKTAPPNLSVRGYEVIDAAKSAVEFLCPSVVSCADIIVMATRDAVSFSGGGWYNVQLGRKDGLVSNAKDVILPPPNISIRDSIAAFAAKGLDITDMVYLLGGHTVGVAQCLLFQDRLYNFQNTGKPDPNMDVTLLNKLRQLCPQNSAGGNTTNLDQNPLSGFVVDKSYHQQILFKKGILQVDQELALDSLTKSTVVAIANSKDFSAKFGQAMVRLGAIVENKKGEIRRSCRRVN